MSQQPERFLQDVLQEPEALRRVITTFGRGDQLDRLGLGETRRVRFVGMGSSRFAALPAASFLRGVGVDAVAERASLAEATPPARDLLVVCISAGGTTTETVEAVARHAGTSRVVAVTNQPSSPLADRADAVLALEVGEEAGGVACRSYQATAAVLLLLAGRLIGRDLLPDLERAPEAAASIVDGRAEWLEQTLTVLGGAIATVAPAERIGSAEQAALVFREGPRIPSHACETGDWAHVDVYLTRRPGYRALLFGGSRSDAIVADWLRRRGGAFVAVGRGVAGAALKIEHGVHGTFAEPVIETCVSDLLAAEMWRQALTEA
jgi:glucosamine--fructose-6-phosphate aminotransferase (isomerizing)